jgi:hypothetical protein
VISAAMPCGPVSGRTVASMISTPNVRATFFQPADEFLVLDVERVLVVKQSGKPSARFGNALSCAMKAEMRPASRLVVLVKNPLLRESSG